MSTGSIPSDQAAFFAADIGETKILAASAVSAALSERLSPGRWLVQCVPSDPAAQTWVHVGDFESAAPLTATVGAGPKRIPLGPVVLACEFNVRKDYNDALAAICSAGTATLYITRVSRSA